MACVENEGTHSETVSPQILMTIWLSVALNCKSVRWQKTFMSPVLPIIPMSNSSRVALSLVDIVETALGEKRSATPISLDWSHQIHGFAERCMFSLVLTMNLFSAEPAAPECIKCKKPKETELKNTIYVAYWRSSSFLTVKIQHIKKPSTSKLKRKTAYQLNQQRSPILHYNAISLSLFINQLKLENDWKRPVLSISSFICWCMCCKI